MVELDAELGQWDDAALITRLRADSLWSKDGFNAGYVAEVAHNAGNPAIGAYHLREIKEAWRRRIVGQEAERLLQLSSNGFDADALQSTVGRISEVLAPAVETDKAARFPIISSKALDSQDYTSSPIITEALFAGSPAVIGGMFKSTKTLTGVDAAISIATGRMFLGAWTVPEPRGWSTSLAKAVRRLPRSTADA